ncbi:GPR1/FUN34/yaaH family-domain-containing protein [Triangularia setosa]|uniref:GPR1/FUN34/yaaH family-domain-containing protein n=1 Tax=Triangularia setosa TaxID=2587417 RepID=A0AAN6WFA2_9PEZI|nr:GPR1/FUN34/yaaH family-domain-containing protein [Podospora setosa]
MSNSGGSLAEKDMGHATGAAPNGLGAPTGYYRGGYDPRNPMANIHAGDEPRLPAFGGEFQPGLWRPMEKRQFANPAPLGLSAFALTTFVLSAINLGTRGVNVPNVVVPLAFGYGGLVQLLAGMWEMVVGNTFGATALSSYGGFWIAWGLMLTPHWNILGDGGPYKTDAINSSDPMMSESAMGFFLTGWFIFTTILLLCTLRSTVMFFLLFFTLDLCFLMLACSHYSHSSGNVDMYHTLTKAGGGFGMLAAFLAWYNAFAGIADSRYGLIPVDVIFFVILPSPLNPLLGILTYPASSMTPQLGVGGHFGLHGPSKPWHATSVKPSRYELHEIF